MLTLEFTIEPFVEGNPGQHVLEAVAAAEAFGVTVDFGPFGSSCEVPVARAGEVAQAIITAAFTHGATYVSLAADRGRDDGTDGDTDDGDTDHGEAAP